MTYTPLFSVTTTLFLLCKCLHLCFCHTFLAQDRSGAFTLTRHLHGIVHSFISLLLRLMTVPTVLTFTAQPMHPTPITLMLLSLVLKAFPNSLCDASIPIPIHFPTTSDTKLWKHHLLFWSMVVRRIFLAMV